MVEWEENFEGTNPLANFNEVVQDQGTVAVVANGAFEGKRYLKCISYQVNAQRRNFVKKLFPARDKVYIRAHIKWVKAFPGADKRESVIVVAPDGGGDPYYAVVYASLNGQLYIVYRDDTGLHTIATGKYLELDKWYHVEVCIKKGNGDGEVRLYLNNGEVTAVTGLSNTTVGNLNGFRVGACYADSNEPEWEAHIDCVAYDSNYIGSWKPPTLAQQLAGFMNSMISVLMVIVIMRMMFGLVKRFKR